MRLLNAPDVAYEFGSGTGYRASWGREGLYINEEHRGIWEATKELPGWQDTADSEKLYEMAYHSGAVILEIGMFGGRSATVELRGALRAAAERAGSPVPQFYGVDVDRGSVLRTHHTLTQQGLLDHCLLFHGDLARFHRDVPIVPTMVFVDGDHRYPGVWADLNILRQFLAPGTPVLCHDYMGIEGVRRAIDEWLRTGYYEPMGVFAGSALLKTTGRCPGVVRGLRPETFAAVSKGMLDRYLTGAGISEGWFTRTRRQTAAARAELKGAAVRAGWPWVGGEEEAGRLPATMPNGHPWPKISVVTPSFNQGKYIEQTILSVLNQGYPNVEHIVMDGGSTDETMEVVGRYRDRIAHVVSEKDRGQSHAINKGMALATGEILTWVNSDDMLAPGALAAAAMAFGTWGPDMIAGVCRLYRDGKYIGGHVTSCADNQVLPLGDLLDLDHCWNVGEFFHQPEVMFTRELWEKAGARVDESLFYSMDYELWLRFAKAGARLHVIGRPIAHFRVHEEQKTFSPEKFGTELREVRDRFEAGLGAERPVRAGDRAGVKGALRASVAVEAAAAGRAMALAGHEVTVVGGTAPAAGADVDVTEAARHVLAVGPGAVGRRVARGMLGIAEEAFVVCATPGVAAVVTSAMKRLGLGGGGPRVVEVGGADRVGRALELSAADVLVSDDVRACAEAAACGTPSVGVKEGVVADGITGRLAEWEGDEGVADAIGMLMEDGAYRRDLGAWARLYAENEWSAEAAVHRVHNALTASGTAGRVGLSRKIQFTVAPGRVTEAAPAVEGVEEGFRLVSGFGPWQEAEAGTGRPRCCWGIGPAGKVEVRTGRAGRRRLRIACQNFQAGQAVQVVVGGRVVAEERVPVTSPRVEHVVDVPVEVSRGVNEIELRYAKWAEAAPKKPKRAILITRISCEGGNEEG